MLHNALRYAALGWKVLPLFTIRNGACDCPDPCKADKCMRGKHPRIEHGVRTPRLTRRPSVAGGQWPYPGIAISVEASGLVDIAPDSVEYQAQFIAHGLAKTLARWVTAGALKHADIEDALYAACGTRPRCY